MIRTILLAALAAALVGARAWALPAFPGTQGFGADTVGGRGGQVLQVTSLEDSGPGTLRAALEAEGPRTVVFRVGGIIRLKSHLTVLNPYVTIAGQTAPGSGILIRDAGLHIETHDVIVRHIRVRIGESDVESPGSQDSISLGARQPGQTYNVIIDHCSFSWGIDENAGVWGPVSDTTFQWCVFSEGLMQTSVRDEVHSMGILMGRDSTRTTLHHNLFAHNRGRNPRIQAGLRDIVNNVFYNYGWGACQLSRDPDVNLMANYWRPGPDSNISRPVVHGEQFGSIYVSGNISPDRPDASVSEWAIFVPEAPENQHRAAQPHPVPEVQRQDALAAYPEILAGAGATAPQRDLVDLRIVRQVRLKAGKLINRPEEAGGYPAMRSGIAPVDSDGDGMPDGWERARHLNPHHPADGSADRNGDGYTNLEEYLNELALQGLHD